MVVTQFVLIDFAIRRNQCRNPVANGKRRLATGATDGALTPLEISATERAAQQLLEALGAVPCRLWSVLDFLRMGQFESIPLDDVRVADRAELSQ
jgi:hypothetical protein